MEIAAGTEAQARTRLAPRAIDTRAVSTWALVLAVTLYLAFSDGGYDIQSHAQVGIAVWWIVTVCAAWGLLPVARLTRSASLTLGLFAGFVCWTALGITWSISSGRSFQDLALVSCYLGILALAVMIQRDRESATRHTIAAVAVSVVVVAVCALIARLWPDAFSGSQETSTILAGSRARLAWPLNYWNALAAFMALGLPLLLSLMVSARRIAAQAAAAAAIPLITVCGALTLSRGGAIEGAAALLVFIALTKDRVAKLAAMIAPAAGGAILVVAAFNRHALQKGLTGPVAAHQAHTLAPAIILVCLGVGVLHVGVGLIGRHATPPAWLTPSVKLSRVLLAAGVIVVIVAALAAHLPHHIDHAWNTFKNPVAKVSQTGTSRFNTLSGEGRYQYWVAGFDSAKAHPLTGSGPGTFQLDWLPRAKINSYVINAHSLYVETYTELGLVGLFLLLAFLFSALATLVRQVVQSSHEARTRAAAMTAALVAFMVGAAFDWLWQMAVIPAAIMLLIGASLAPRPGTSAAYESADTGASHGAHRPTHPAFTARIVAVVAGLLCLLALAYPLTTTNAIVHSQNEDRVNDLPAALTSAREAVNLESGSAAAQLQLALVLEQLKQYPAATAAAQHAVTDEPQGWQNWLVLSRIYAERGEAQRSVYAYTQAKKMNPRSPVFNS